MPSLSLRFISCVESWEQLNRRLTIWNAAWQKARRHAPELPRRYQHVNKERMILEFFQDQKPERSQVVTGLIKDKGNVDQMDDNL